MDEKATGGLAPDSLTRLLSLGLKSGTRPIDELIEELEEGGSEWFEKWKAGGPFATVGLPPQKILDGEAQLDELRAVYKESKRLLKQAGSKEDRLDALAGYFIATGAAIVLHGTLIPDRSRSELDPIFADLAAALPEPWSEFLSRAVERPAEE